MVSGLRVLARKRSLYRAEGPLIFAGNRHRKGAISMPSRDGTAGLPSTPDIFGDCRHGRVVPIADSCTAANSIFIRFTSSASPSTFGGISRPSALLVALENAAGIDADAGKGV